MGEKEWKQAESPTITLDAVDRKLLSILQHNCRASHKNLSTFLGISKPTVAYRIARLEKEGVIRGYKTHFRLLTGHYIYAVITANHTQPTKVEQELLKKLKNKSGVLTAYSTSGTSRLLIVLAVPATQDITQFLHWLTNEIPISDYQVASAVNITLNPVQYTSPPLHAHDLDWKKDASFERDFEDTKIEKKPIVSEDIQILKRIENNPCFSITHLAQQTNQHSITLKKEIRRLIREGTILKFSATINPYALGYPLLCVAAISLVDPKQVHELKKFVAQRNVSNGIVEVTNRMNLLLFLYFRSTAEQHTFEDELFTRFPAIRDCHMDILHEQTHLSWIPSREG